LTTPPDQMRAVVQELYQLIVCTGAHEGQVTIDTMQRHITHLLTHLLQLSRTAPTVTVQLPPEVIDYVQSGRNPDIYTREFVELAQRMNQTLKGRSDAYARFRDILAREVVGAMPELERGAGRVVVGTGGYWSATRTAEG
ncbi:mediator of RNA polymerase II transcription subunit 10, partial [Eremomyces bilateralis CBS 781.70]